MLLDLLSLETGSSTNAYDYVGSGGIVLSGSAPLALGKNYAAAGGILWSGTAPETQGHNYVPGGGITLGGAAPTQQGHAYTPTGGLALAGSTPLTQGHQYAPAGGLSLAGTGPKTLGKNYLPAGGISLAGTAGLKGTWSLVGSGGLVLGSTAPKILGKNYSPAGGINWAGAAALIGTWSYTGAGGIAWSGAAPTSGSGSHAYVPAGGIAWAGAAIKTVGHVYQTVGGLLLAGAAPKTFGRVYLPTGGIVWQGTAPQIVGQVYPVSGGILWSGAAATSILSPHNYTPTGGINWSGTSPLTIGRVYTSSGGFALSGVAQYSLGRNYTPGGGLELSGQAPLLIGRVWLPLGGIRFAGSAQTTYVPSFEVTIASPLYADLGNYFELPAMLHQTTPAPVTYAWAQTNGWEEAQIDFTDQLEPTVHFVKGGWYTFQLLAQSGSFESTATVDIYVNFPPLVDAGPNRTAPWSLAPVALLGRVELGISAPPSPPEGLSQLWTKVYGPGLVVFTDATQAVTTAVFSRPGLYTLRLTAASGDLTNWSEVTLNLQGAIVPAPPSRPRKPVVTQSVPACVLVASGRCTARQIPVPQAIWNGVVPSTPPPDKDQVNGGLLPVRVTESIPSCVLVASGRCTSRQPVLD